MGNQTGAPGTQAGQTGTVSKPKFPLYPLAPKPVSLPAESPWPNPFEPIAETNKRTANESAFAARKPGPPNPDVPKPRKPPSKFGISDTSDPMPELEKPAPPTDELPKLELPKAEPPKREPPKCVMVPPVENDENDENRGDACRFPEKRFKLKPGPVSRAFDDVARFLPKDENPELFRPKAAFLEFPNECH